MSSIYETIKSFFDVPLPADRLDRKVNLLVVFSAIQTVTLLLIAIMMFAGSIIPSWTTMFFLLIALGAVAWIFRDRIPGWSAMAFRSVASLMNRGRTKGADANSSASSNVADRKRDSRTSTEYTADRTFR